MRFLIYTLAELITPMILLPTVIAVYGKIKRYTPRRTVNCILFSVYMAAVYWVTGLPNMVYYRFEPNIYLIPFWEIASDFRNSILNVLLFVPLGFFLPTLSNRYRSESKTILFGLLMSILIEMLQMFTFRATDINDVITNVFGAWLGWCLWHLVYKRLGWQNAVRRKGWDIPVCCGAVWAVMFCIQPFTYEFLWKLIIQ